MRVFVVDVAACNSKVCYVIVPSTTGDAVHRVPVPIEGVTKVADAVLGSEGLAATASKGGVWVYRGSSSKVKILEVDWRAITESGLLATNYRLEPGDRVYVGKQPPQ